MGGSFLTKKIVNSQKQLAEIDLLKNCIYVVKNGELIHVEPPNTGYGEQIAIWMAGKVDRVETKTCRKL